MFLINGEAGISGELAILEFCFSKIYFRLKHQKGINCARHYYDMKNEHDKKNTTH